MLPRRLSQPFVAAVAGLSITAAGLITPLRWPLWPVDWILDALRIADPYGDAHGAGRVAILALLILANSVAWAVPLSVLLAAFRRRFEA